MSTDLPILESFETAATLYQKEEQKFHVLLEHPKIPISLAEYNLNEGEISPNPVKNILWLEISPYRVVMTMQGHGNLSYRHFWEQGIYGVSRYWLHSHNDTSSPSGEDKGINMSFLRLRNFTRSLTLKTRNLPEHLRVEYELWSDKLKLGHYVLHLEIDV
jgi:hypothetical protein